MTDDPNRDAEIEAKFWTALRKDMTVMLSIVEPTRVAPRPMTAQLDGDGDRGPVWFFGSRSSELAKHAISPAKAGFTFVDKGHGVWATVEGHLVVDMNRAKIDALWNPHVAAWYEEGKDDPDLCLMRFDPAEAEIWLDGSSLVAGIKALLGADPQADYRKNKAEVSLG